MSGASASDLTKEKYHLSAVAAPPASGPTSRPAIGAESTPPRASLAGSNDIVSAPYYNTGQLCKASRDAIPSPSVAFRKITL